MFKEKSKSLKNSPKKSKLDHILFFVENYFPQKKQRANHDGLCLDTFEGKPINQFHKFNSIFTTLFNSNSSNKKISFTIGSWALPYLKFLKKIGMVN